MEGRREDVLNIKERKREGRRGKENGERTEWVTGI